MRKTVDSFESGQLIPSSNVDRIQYNIVTQYVCVLSLFPFNHHRLLFATIENDPKNSNTRKISINMSQNILNGKSNGIEDDIKVTL